MEGRGFGCGREPRRRYLGWDADKSASVATVASSLVPCRDASRDPATGAAGSGTTGYRWGKRREARGRIRRWHPGVRPSRAGGASEGLIADPGRRYLRPVCGARMVSAFLLLCHGGERGHPDDGRCVRVPEPEKTWSCCSVTVPV